MDGDDNVPNFSLNKPSSSELVSGYLENFKNSHIFCWKDGSCIDKSKFGMEGKAC